MELIIIPKGELEILIIDCVRACLEIEHPVTDNPDTLPEWLTRKQVARYLNCSLATVDNYARQGFLEKHRINGGLIRFRSEEVRRAANDLRS